MKGEIENGAITVGFLHSEQVCAPTNQLIAGRFDVVLTASSWEPRCMEILKLQNLSAKLGLLLLFDEMGKTGRRERHDQVLTEWLRGCTDQQRFVRGVRSTDESAVFKRLIESIDTCYKFFGRPFSILVDISCFPKPYFLLALAYSLKSGYVNEISLFYSQAEYSNDYTEAVLRRRYRENSYFFTEGEWRGVAVPFLERGISLEKDNEIVATLGFEGRRSEKFIKKYDPDEVTIIIANPGFTDGYTEVSVIENQFIVKSFAIIENEIVNFGAGDMNSVFKFAVSFAKNHGGHSALSYFCLGTKPHALGMGLAALVVDNTPVIARLPERFIEKNTNASGISWLYRVLDMSAI